MPALPHDVIVADVIYPAVLLAFGWGIALLPMMVGCIHSGLRAMAKIFYKVEALVDAKGNVLTDSMVILRSKCPIPELNFCIPI